jgi:hypothetical protein
VSDTITKPRRLTIEYKDRLTEHELRASGALYWAIYYVDIYAWRYGNIFQKIKAALELRRIFKEYLREWMNK